MLTAEQKIEELLSLLHGEPLFLSGSAVAEAVYGLSNAHEDVDVFAPNMNSVMTATQILLDNGFVLEERFERVWDRWKRYGTNKWHTNSMKIQHPRIGEVNLIHKLIGGNPVTSLAQVLESFDFGLLAMGYDLRVGALQDMRSYCFPGYDIEGPLPLMLNKRQDWRNGFISQYNGIRESGRYAKYHRYGYDMSAVKEDLITGYQEACEYLYSRDKQEKQDLAQIYALISDKIELDQIDELLEASKQIVYLDALDDIMEALE